MNAIDVTAVTKSNKGWTATNELLNKLKGIGSNVHASPQKLKYKTGQA